MAVDCGVHGEDDFFDRRVFGPRDKVCNIKVFGADAVYRRQGPAEDIIAPAKRARAFLNAAGQSASRTIDDAMVFPVSAQDLSRYRATRGGVIS